MKYEAASYRGHVLFVLRGRDRHEGTLEDYVAGWKEVLTGSVDDLVLPGDHVTMFESGKRPASRGETSPGNSARTC